MWADLDGHFFGLFFEKNAAPAFFIRFIVFIFIECIIQINDKKAHNSNVLFTYIL